MATEDEKVDEGIGEALMLETGATAEEAADIIKSALGITVEEEI